MKRPKINIAVFAMSFVVLTAALFLLKAFATVDLPEENVKELPNWQAYEQKISLQCSGPFITIKKPETISAGSTSYKLTGYKLTQTAGSKPVSVKLGVVSTSKDLTEETKYNLAEFVKWFKSESVNAIIMGGDIHDTATGVTDMLSILGESGLLVAAISGNNDIRGEFNSGIKKLREKYPNVVNMNLVRMVDGKGYDIISLPGYYDPQYTASRNTCVYTDKDISAMSQLVKESNDPIIFLTHGPPKDVGKNGIDYITSGLNVGDDKMTAFIEKYQIPFGTFGHIIEAGGKATDLKGTVIPEDKYSPKLYLNPGSASGVYWSLNSGSTSVGMAAILEISAGKAKYKIKHISPDEHKKIAPDENVREQKELEELRALDPKSKSK